MDTYKKKYKEALERARVWKDKSGMPADKQGILDDIFPELAGSEDEQIRKELTKHLKEGVEGYMPAGDSSDYRRWLDWLEKQDKSSDQIHYWTEEEIEPIISDYLRGAEHYGGMIARLRCLKPKSLEKQAQKSTIEMKSAEESLGIDSDTYNEIVDECIYGEQKSADKVEPKFKVGDKIIKFSKTPCPVHDSTDDTVCEVVEVQDACYILNTKEGKIQEPFEWQDYYKFVEPKTTWSERMKRNLKITFLPISALITSILKNQNTML